MTTIKKIKKIMFKSEIVPKLCKDFGCSRGTVYYALRYVSNSKQAENIRKKALGSYGAIETKVPVLAE